MGGLHKIYQGKNQNIIFRIIQKDSNNNGTLPIFDMTEICLNYKEDIENRNRKKRRK